MLVKLKKVLQLSVAAVFLLSGCMATTQNSDQHTGKVLGGLVGAGLGALLCEDNKVACAAGGLAVGLVVGHIIDDRRKRVAAIAEKEGIRGIQTININDDNRELRGDHTIIPGDFFEHGGASLSGQGRALPGIIKAYERTESRGSLQVAVVAQGTSDAEKLLAQERANKLRDSVRSSRDIGFTTASPEEIGLSEQAAKTPQRVIITEIIEERRS